MMKRIIIFHLLIALLLWLPGSLRAEATVVADSLADNTAAGFYVGLHTGMPVAEANFASFAADKYRPAWSMGIHTGYRFTEAWSLELTAAWGQLFLAEQDCCQRYGYILGSDLERYLPRLFPTDMEGITYADLLSRVFVQRYGVQVNMNLLGLFVPAGTSPWRLELSPALYAVGTSATLVAKTGKAPLAENVSSWHLGYGAQLSASYALTERMRVGLYGGFTQLTGKPMDGTPRMHSTHYIADAGVKFTLSLGKGAEAVKRVLGQWLIPADRVETVGAGIKYDAPSYDEARVPTTIEIINE